MLHITIRNLYVQGNGLHDRYAKCNTNERCRKMKYELGFMMDCPPKA